MKEKDTKILMAALGHHSIQTEVTSFVAKSAIIVFDF